MSKCIGGKNLAVCPLHGWNDVQDVTAVANVTQECLSTLHARRRMKGINWKKATVQAFYRFLLVSAAALFYVIFASFMAQ